MAYEFNKLYIIKRTTIDMNSSVGNLVLLIFIDFDNGKLTIN